MSHSNREFDSLPSPAGGNSSPAAAKVEMNAADESGAACGRNVCPHQSVRACACVCVCVGSAVILRAGLITGGNLTKPFAALPGQSR